MICLFLEHLSHAVNESKYLMGTKPVRIVAQFDADGITSATIICKMLLREGINFELRIVKQLTKEEIDDLETEGKMLIFLDCGSGQIDQLKHLADDNSILIIDHHLPADEEHPNILHVNPMLHGEGELSASIVSYLFAKNFNQQNSDLIDLAIIGAVGDAQDEDEGFNDTLKKFVSEEEIAGKVSITTGIRVYGYNTRPVFKALAYTYDPYIPGISGSESNAVQFLADIGISATDGQDWRRMCDLSIEEQKRLASALILQRLGLPEDAVKIFGNIYTLIGKPPELQDAKEFATLLNACSRTGDVETALRICLGDFSVLERSKEVIETYRKILSDALNLVGTSLITGKNANFLFAEDKISDAVIGTVVSIALNSNMVEQTKPMFGLANVDGKTVKVSARSRGSENLAEIVLKASKLVGGYGGGHKHAAGAFIPKGKEKEFISIIDSLLSGTNGNQEG